MTKIKTKTPMTYAEFRELARCHAREALGRIASLAKSDDPRVAIKATGVLLAYALGRPGQTPALPDVEPIDLNRATCEKRIEVLEGALAVERHRLALERAAKAEATTDLTVPVGDA